MNKEEMNKYAYDLMVKNNPEETVKNLLLKDKENQKLNEIIETLKETNKLLINQKYKLEYELDKLDELRDKAIEEINYMITNADITEISAIKLKQILGDKGEDK